MNRIRVILTAFCTLLLATAPVWAQSSGGIRGVIYDSDFNAPLGGAEITVAETGQKVQATEEGNYVISGLAPGTYTLVVSKEGYTRKVFADVVVPAGSMTDQDAQLSGEFTDMEEFVVQDLNMGGSSEEGLLNLRMEAPALMDSIGSDLMSKAGASDAAQALTLVPGTTIQDGKYAVVRGLPDRYVNSQMNSVRLPSADPDKRAVQLDQFPSEMIESVQVSKTFTPDQQGDASGGAVNIILKGIPDERVLKLKLGSKYNTNVGDAGDRFLKDNGTSLSYWGHDAGDIQPQDISSPWTGTLGVSRGDSPAMYDWSITAGDKFEAGSDLKIGFIGSVFYKRDASYYENGRDNKYFIDNRPYVGFQPPQLGSTLVPRYSGNAYSGLDFSTWPPGVTYGQTEVMTSLFDVTRGKEELQWGTLGAIGAETENHSLMLLYSYNFSGENTARLAEDTRGKYFFFPGYDPDDPTSPGGADSPDGDFKNFAPFRRNESLEYTERIASSLQLRGNHTIPTGEKQLGTTLTIKEPEFDWTVARSGSSLDTPDRRTLGTFWFVDENGVPFYALNSGEGGVAELQRKWRNVEEVSDQYFYNLKLPFSLWNGEDGFVKFGVFDDQVDRKYDENTYFTTQTLGTSADWDVMWSETLSTLPVTMKDYPYDVSYDGDQEISAWYYMAELPVFSFFKLTGGTRFEKTGISTAMREVDPKAQLYIPSDNHQGFDFAGNEDAANASIQQSDMLPSLGFEFTPVEKIKVRGSYTETVARMTFKELAPIQQVEEIGDDIFIGNPDLQMSALKNYDLRFDYTPYPGGLISLSWFIKEIKDPIDYRQVLLGGSTLATTADNYSNGKINGYEVELRQSLGEWWKPLDGLTVGGNVTLIKSELNASGAEINSLLDAGLDAIVDAEYGAGLTRDMMGAPEYLYNLNATYTLPKFGTELGLFYTVKGDALKAAGTQDGNKYIPHVYEKEYATLNFSLSQRLGKRWKLGFKAKNLLDPEIESVYRSNYTGEEVVKTSYKKGMEFSISLGCEF